MLRTVLLLSTTLLCVSCTFFNTNNNCATNTAICDPDECCVGLSLLGQCQLLGQVGQSCETFPQKDLLNGNLYQHVCPCAAGLRCIPQDNIGIQLLGNCQVNPNLVTTLAPVAGTVNAVSNTTGTAVANTGTAVNNTAAGVATGVNNVGSAAQNLTAAG